MKIFNIIAIPAIIGFYYNIYAISKSCIDDFKYYLQSSYFELVEYKIYKTKYYPIYDKFTNFYFDKTRLDRYLNCKYEDELGIPKCVILKESFIVDTEMGTTRISLLKIENGELYVRVEN